MESTVRVYLYYSWLEKAKGSATAKSAELKAYTVIIGLIHGVTEFSSSNALHFTPVPLKLLQHREEKF